MSFVVGDKVPDFELVGNGGIQVSLAQLREEAVKGVVVYFYPRAGTPGCTTEACDFRDSLSSLKAHGYLVVGVSPDKPEALDKFVAKEDLNFVLAADPEHTVMQTWGAWGEKQNYGKTVVGTIRSTVVINKDGITEQALYNIKAKGHVARLRKLLGID